LFKTSIFHSKWTLLFKGILFCIFLYLLYTRAQKLDFSEFEIENYLALIGCLIFTPINWFFEWMKWQLILMKLDEKDNPINFKAFASGIIASFLTPSLSGNFLGRMLYYDKNKRWKISILSTIANFSQFLIALLFGLFALVILKHTLPFSKNNYIFIPVSFILVLLYFFGEQLAKKIPVTQIQLVVNQIQKDNSRLSFLLISLVRYIIFVIQYSFALCAFGIKLEFETITIIMLVFLFISITPSLFFGKIMVRESIAVTIFGIFGYETVSVIFASFSTWFFNLFLTAIISLFIVKKKSR
jgi:hypothetical protein